MVPATQEDRDELSKQEQARVGAALAIGKLQEEREKLGGGVKLLSGTTAELPSYRCHKVVRALKIHQVIDPTQPGNESDGSRMLHPMDARFSPFRVDGDYARKHNPQSGGYFVVYDDGYKSFSPAIAFEAGYTKI